MQQCLKSVIILAFLCGTTLSLDYVNVKRKEGLLSSAVLEIGGRSSSIPFWPLGTEYRITLTAIPTLDQLEALKITNRMRGSVAIAFEDSEPTADDLASLRENLNRCHLFVVQKAK